jgi:hypothetical protein
MDHGMRPHNGRPALNRRLALPWTLSAGVGRRLDGLERLADPTGCRPGSSAVGGSPWAGRRLEQLEGDAVRIGGVRRVPAAVGPGGDRHGRALLKRTPAARRRVKVAWRSGTLKAKAAVPGLGVAVSSQVLHVQTGVVNAADAGHGTRRLRPLRRPQKLLASQ